MDENFVYSNELAVNNPLLKNGLSRHPKVSEDDFFHEIIYINIDSENVVEYTRKKGVDSISSCKKTDLNSEFKAKNYKCIECKETFTLVKLLKKHCKDTSHQFPKRYSCDLCPMKFSKTSGLKYHLRTHNREKPYSCNECDKKFSQRGNLIRHTRMHNGEKVFVCETCNKGFTRKETLTFHMKLHYKEIRHKIFLPNYTRRSQTKRDGLKTKMECSICKKLMTRGSLYNHKKIQHSDVPKSFLCNMCGKTFTSKISLETHQNVHTKKVTYNCDICSKSFIFKNSVKKHMLIHSGERPHSCDLCGKTFIQKGHLDGHMKVHTGIKPYHCTYCDRAFAVSGNLTVHMRIHSKETPYHCSSCDKGFFDSSSKKRHESRCLLTTSG